MLKDVAFALILCGAAIGVTSGLIIADLRYQEYTRHSMSLSESEFASFKMKSKVVYDIGVPFQQERILEIMEDGIQYRDYLEVDQMYYSEESEEVQKVYGLLKQGN